MNWEIEWSAGQPIIKSIEPSPVIIWSVGQPYLVWESGDFVEFSGVDLFGLEVG
jgi:hypothetical protein